MRKHFIGSILAVVAALAFSPHMLAQTAQPSKTDWARIAGHAADLSGVWTKLDVPHRHFNAENIPPMLPWAAEQFKAIREGVERPNDQGRDDLDPVVIECAPPGLTRIMGYPEQFPFEIIQIPGRVLFYFELGHWVRQIWTDGRDHIENPDPSWMGDSIGRWDGDTLVVDTIGLKEAWIDNRGYPHSDAFHVVERIRRVDQDTLEVNFTFEDPKAYQGSWEGKLAYRLRPGVPRSSRRIPAGRCSRCPAHR